MSDRSSSLSGARPARERAAADLVFVAFNSQVLALDRYTGEQVWHWKSPHRGGFVSLMIDGDRLIASCQGYTYCLDPLFGQEVWSNELKGLGVGITSLASFNAPYTVSSSAAAASAEAQRQHAAAAAAAAT